MVKIQIDLSDQEDKIVEVYKLVNSLKTKEDAIKDIVQHFRVKIIPELLDAHEVYAKKAKSFLDRGGKKKK